MRFAVLALALTVGCTTSRMVPRGHTLRPLRICGNDTGPEWPVAIGVTLGTILIGGAVGAGYFALGGELPAR